MPAPFITMTTRLQKRQQPGSNLPGLLHRIKSSSDQLKLPDAVSLEHLLAIVLRARLEGDFCGPA